MGILDALTILGSGVARGYRGSQELQRQLAEAKRKALIEEREMAMREEAQNVQNALARAQTAEAGVDTESKGFSLGRARADATRDDTPIMSGGIPRLRIGGQEFDIPNKFSSIRDPNIADLLKQVSEQEFMHNNPNYYMRYPPVGRGGNMSFTNTPEGRALKYMQLVFGTNIPPLMGEDEDSYTARVTQERQQRLNFLLNNKDTVDKLLEGMGSDSTKAGSDSTKTDRFKVKVNLQSK